MKLYEDLEHHFGTYHDFIDTPNLLDANNLYDFPVPKLLRNFRLKEWQAFQIISDRYFILGAVYNMKWMGISQCVVYDSKQHRVYDYHKNTSSIAQHVAKGLDNTVSKYNGRRHRMVIHNDIGEKHFSVDINHEDFYLMGRGHFDAPALSIYHPFDGNRGVYSSKIAMPFDGTMTLDGHTCRLNRAILIMDDHKGFYPWHMTYHWVTGASYVGDHLCAFNFTRNQVLNPDLNNENVLWYNDEIHHFKSVTINKAFNTWHITDSENRINLRFHEEADYQIHKDFLAMKVDYYAPIGRFDGTILLEDGSLIDVSHFLGMAEFIDNRV